MIGIRTLLAAAFSLLAGCGGSALPGPEPWLRDEAHERGLTFSWASGHDQRYYFPEIMGGGAALFDLEGDGDLDAYLVQAGSVLLAAAERPGNRLFRNRGAGKFEDISTDSGSDDRGYGMGVAAGDADGDGRTDLYVTNLEANVLLRNRGDATFANRTGNTGDASWSTSAAFVDLDRDGDLDLYVTNYVHWSVADERVCIARPHSEDYCSPNSYSAPAFDSLFENDGRGAFTDVSQASGIRAVAANGLGVVCLDQDGDGWTDVFVANDQTLNQLWRNKGALRFQNVAVVVGCAVDQQGRKKAGMGTDAADVDFDGDEDLLVVNLAGETDSFYRNDGARFSERTPVMGLAATSRPFTRFGVGFADFDQDGFLDLYQANGRVTRLPESAVERPFEEPNVVMRGSALRFEEVLPRGGTRELLIATSRGAALGDVDGDGGIDVLVVNRDADAYLLMNRVPGRGHWLAFRVREEGGRHALGARLSTEHEGRAIVRTVRSAYGYCTANAPWVHLGLAARKRLESDVLVTWADGEEEVFAGPFEGDRIHDLRRGAGSVTGR
jgi:hypothetical protein